MSAMVHHVPIYSTNAQSGGTNPTAVISSISSSGLQAGLSAPVMSYTLQAAPSVSQIIATKQEPVDFLGLQGGDGVGAYQVVAGHNGQAYMIRDAQLQLVDQQQLVALQHQLGEPALQQQQQQQQQQPDQQQQQQQQPRTVAVATADALPGIEDDANRSITSGGSQRKRPVPTISTGRRSLKSEKVNNEESMRRAKRRERNRVAAAKCRKKRQDQIECLSESVQNLESDNTELENEIADLQTKKSQLLFLLQAHKLECPDPGQLVIPTLAPVPSVEASRPEAPSVNTPTPPSLNQTCNSTDGLDETESCVSSSSAALNSSFNAGLPSGGQEMSGSVPASSSLARRPSDLPLPPLHSMVAEFPSLNTPNFAAPQAAGARVAVFGQAPVKMETPHANDSYLDL